jgi:hypothetical protein
LSYFKDADDVYSHLGRLISELMEDPELGARFRKANTILCYEYSDPDSTITVRLEEGEPSTVDFGESELEPEVVMSMPADVAHRFWLGKVNVAVALTRGQIKARGPVNKVLRLVPLAKPAFPRYREQLIAQGREDLIDA